MSSSKRKVFVDVATLSQYYFDLVGIHLRYYQQFFRAGLCPRLGVKLIDLGYYVGKQPLY